MAKIVGCHKNSHDNQVKKVSCREKLVFNSVKLYLTTNYHYFP